MDKKKFLSFDILKALTGWWNARTIWIEMTYAYRHMCTPRERGREWLSPSQKYACSTLKWEKSTLRESKQAKEGACKWESVVVCYAQLFPNPSLIKEYISPTWQLRNDVLVAVMNGMHAQSVDSPAVNI